MRQRQVTGAPMIERKLIGVATAIGAAVWLAGAVFFRAERRNLDRSRRRLD